MKTRPLAAATLLAVLLSAGCNKSSPATERKLAELEQQAADAKRRQQELEKELAEQKLAAERDAIERERMRIEQDRLDMERQQGEAAAAAAEELRRREAELATREGKVELLNSQLETKQEELEKRGEELSEKDRELAGREALDDARERTRPDDTPAGDYGMFYESLSPYGSWFETPDYGYVWQPVVVRNGSWRPYLHGRWACTDRGWTWMSDEPFGWATYHYGRWALCRGYGWVWVPGSEWAPSWVCWRSSGNHVGWAPLPPETLAYRGRSWDSTVEASFGIGALWFNFVETRNFCEPIHHHCLPYTQNDIYIYQTVNITHIHVKDNRVICGGPTYGDIARQTKRKPPFYRIEEDRKARPGHDPIHMRYRVEEGRLRVARPVISSDWDETVKPRHIKGRIESFDVERKEPLKPEVRDLVRQTREQNRKKTQQPEDPPRVDRPTRVEERPLPRHPDPIPGNREVAGRDPKPVSPKAESRTEEPRVQVLPKANEPNGGKGRREEGGMTQQEKNNEIAVKLQEELRRQNDKIRVLPKDAGPEKPDPLPRPDSRNEATRNERQELEKQRETERRNQLDKQRETERQQRMEQERQQQREAERRQQQIEETRRQQQREAERQQREAERQQQREMERQQQREAERQQQQMEEARRQQQREMERQQQREAERQQQRMEESRREQQREAERQQERSRQQRSEEEQRGRGKNR